MGDTGVEGRGGGVLGREIDVVVGCLTTVVVVVRVSSLDQDQIAFSLPIILSVFLELNQFLVKV